MNRRERLADVGDTTLFLREWGNEGTPIVFWHALGDHTSMQMVEAGPILAQDLGYRVIGVDAPGFGGSPRLPDERYEMPALVALVRDLLQALGFERPIWSGSSWGAMIGVQLAAAHPDDLRGLVLLDGGYLDPEDAEGQTLEQLRAHWRSQPGFRFPSWEALVEDARNYFGRWTPEIEECVRTGFREADGEIVSIMGPDVYAAAIHGVNLAPPSRALARLGETGLPVLLLAATEPPPDPEQRDAGLRHFAHHVPHADVRPVEGARHFLLEDRPAETARAVGEWVRELP